MSESDEQTLAKIKQKYRLNNDEAISLCIQTTYAKILENTEIHEDIIKTLEYVKLLVKTNPNLPSRDQEEQMSQVVNRESRFEKLIEEKVKVK